MKNNIEHVKIVRTKHCGILKSTVSHLVEGSVVSVNAFNVAAFVLGSEAVGWAADVTTDGVDGSSANLTSRDSRSKVARFEGFRHWFGELLVGVNSGQPETVGGSKVVAGTSTVAFNEWRRSEGFQARTWRRKTLSATLGTGAGVHNE